ncbi:MAG TPA: hypothetical protein VLA16_26120 [Ideonella sp.]|nr:hypothetical protein [Ideonella sp.]
MINNTLSGASAISAYVNSLLAKAGKASEGSSSTTATGSTGTMQASAKAALQTAAQSFKSSTAQHALETRQGALAAELKAGLAKAGVKLEGAVEFSLDSKGELSIDGSEKDLAAVKAFLKGDTGKPSLSSRLTDLANDADQLSGTIRQSAAISQAARYAGNSSNVMSLYTSLMQQQESASAVFSFSADASSLTYPGVLASKA